MVIVMLMLRDVVAMSGDSMAMPGDVKAILWYCHGDGMMVSRDVMAI
jgi:hypothetical protein